MEDLDLRPLFWQDRRVLLTGHTGFKGSWMAIWLHRLGAKVVGLSLDPPSSPSLFDLAGIGELMTADIRADINQSEALRSAIDEHQPEIIFHMAAQALVRASYQSPLETWATNVMGTLNLLEAIRRSGRPCTVVNVTSDKCYRNTERTAAYGEDDCLGGSDPYSASKAAAEIATASWRQSFFGSKAATSGVAGTTSGAGDAARPAVRLATARAGNVLGGGDYAADRLVPDCVRAFQASQPVLIRNPGAVRPWQFVLDPLEGYLRLAEAMNQQGEDFADAWNFGPPADDARTVEWTVSRAAELWANGASWQSDGGDHPRESGRLTIDAGKAHRLLNWQIRLPAEETMQWTMSWYRQLHDGAAARDLCLDQIERFENLQGVRQ